VAPTQGGGGYTVEHDLPTGVRPQGLNVHWRGHAFLFEKKRSPTYGATGGLRLLLIFFTLEGVIGPRLWLFSWFRLPLPPVWLRVPILLGLALLLIRFVAGLKLSEIGLYRWREWSATERSYFVQVFLIANLVFSVLFADRLRHFMHTHPALPMFAGIFAIGLFFGVLFGTSGNLWMVAIFHGIGNSYIEGTQLH
jgi:hypothetical protein